MSKQKNRTSQLVTHEGVAPREEHSPNLAQDLDLLRPWPPFSEDSGQSRQTGDEGGGACLPHHILAHLDAKPSSLIDLVHITIYPNQIFIPSVGPVVCILRVIVTTELTT